MLIKECEYLLRWVASAIHDTTPAELPAGLSFQKIYDLAMMHDVCNLAFYAVEKLQRKPDEPLYTQWRTRRDLALMRDMHQEHAREELVKAFREKDIPFLELQGTVIKEYYPHREYRTMSDLDFIVPTERLDEAGQILRNLGYALRIQGNFEIDGKRAPNIYVELHTEYFPKNTFLYNSMGDPDFRKDKSPEETIREFYLYNVIHVAKHYFSAGCGIRRVLDLYLLQARYGEELEHMDIDRDLEKVGIADFTGEINALAQDWFRPEGFRWTESQMAEQILLSPLHGQRENFIHSRITDIGGEGTARPVAKLKYLLHRLFPGRVVMHKHYPFLKKWVILYPFCWIHRGIKLVTSGRLSRAKKELYTVISASEDHRKRK